MFALSVLERRMCLVWCGVFARVGVYGYVMHCVVIVVVVVLVVASVLALMLWLLCGEKNEISRP